MFETYENIAFFKPSVGVRALTAKFEGQMILDDLRSTF